MRYVRAPLHLAEGAREPMGIFCPPPYLEGRGGNLYPIFILLLNGVPIQINLSVGLTESERGSHAVLRSELANKLIII